jgi:fused signal recognition particle receptor
MHTDWLDTLSVVGACVAVLFVLVGILRLQGHRRRARMDALESSVDPQSLAPHRDQAQAPSASEPPVSVAEGQPHATPPKPTIAPADAAPTQDAALAAGLARTRGSLWGRMAQILSGAQKIDESVFEALEEVLILSDVGVAMTMELIDALREKVQSGHHDAEAVRALLREQVRNVLQHAVSDQDPLAVAQDAKPRVILFVGVNGVGKTTTIGKVAHLLAEKKQKVVLAAGDTFRAAAAEQLAIWGERTGARVVRGAEQADPASVMFNAMQAAQADNADVLLADTAGRLHTDAGLMDEIKKVRRALGRLRPGAPEETWLVVDATTGQNALHQAKEFHQALGLTGIILTKLDGTAKGGIVVAIAHALGVKVRFVGVGEQASALRPFDAQAFVEALI